MKKLDLCPKCKKKNKDILIENVKILREEIKGLKREYNFMSNPNKNAQTSCFMRVAMKQAQIEILMIVAKLTEEEVK